MELGYKTPPSLLLQTSPPQTARVLVSILDEVVTAFDEDVDNVVLGTM